MVMMMMMRIFSLFFFNHLLNSNPLVFEFNIDNVNQTSQVLNLNAKVKADKILRDKAYLAFNIYHFNPSKCWNDFIKNKTIKMSTSDSYIKLKNMSDTHYSFEFYFNPNKIKLLNVKKDEFINFCFK